MSDYTCQRCGIPSYGAYLAQQSKEAKELADLRAVVEAARALMLAEPPCHCGEMAPGPCCEACRRERALRDALAKLDDR